MNMYTCSLLSKSTCIYPDNNEHVYTQLKIIFLKIISISFGDFLLDNTKYSMALRYIITKQKDPFSLYISKITMRSLKTIYNKYVENLKCNYDEYFYDFIFSDIIFFKNIRKIVGLPGKTFSLFKLLF